MKRNRLVALQVKIFRVGPILPRSGTNEKRRDIAAAAL